MVCANVGLIIDSGSFLKEDVDGIMASGSVLSGSDVIKWYLQNWSDFKICRSSPSSIALTEVLVCVFWFWLVGSWKAPKWINLAIVSSPC